MAEVIKITGKNYAVFKSTRGLYVAVMQSHRNMLEVRRSWMLSEL